MDARKHTNARTHAQVRAHTRADTHTHTHTHTHITHACIRTFLRSPPPVAAVVSDMSFAACSSVLSNQLDLYRTDMVTAAQRGFANAAAIESARCVPHDVRMPFSAGHVGGNLTSLPHQGRGIRAATIETVRGGRGAAQQDAGCAMRPRTRARQCVE